MRRSGANRRPPDLPWCRQLHVRLTLSGLLVLVLLAAGGLPLLAQQRQRDRDAWQQQQNLGLASYILQRRVQPFFDDRGRLVNRLAADTGMYAAMINPGLELHLLDAQGRIVDSTLATLATPVVDLAPVRRLLGERPALPVYGDDPGSALARSIVSVAELRGAGRLDGYLYVVLRGARAAALTREADTAQQWRESGLVLSSALVLAALLTFGLQRQVTRPLRELSGRLAGYRAAPRGGGPEATIAPPGSEVEVVAQAVEALQSRIDRQIGQLQQSDRMRRELISNLSHDLHTPLSNVQGYVETLLLGGDKLDAAERERNLRVALEHCRRTGRRVKDLFELSRLESPQMAATMEPFVLAELLNDIVSGYALAAEQRGIRLQLDVGDSGAAQAEVRADIGLIERVFQNLIDNALRYTPTGGCITLQLASAGAQVQVRVHNSGRGIPAADLPHIFERHWSDGIGARPDTASAQVSRGLGLAIVRRILELHDSTIAVASGTAGPDAGSADAGTEFSFALRTAG